MYFGSYHVLNSSSTSKETTFFNMSNTFHFLVWIWVDNCFNVHPHKLTSTKDCGSSMYAYALRGQRSSNFWLCLPETQVFLTGKNILIFQVCFKDYWRKQEYLGVHRKKEKNQDLDTYLSFCLTFYLCYTHAKVFALNAKIPHTGETESHGKCG